MNIKNLMKEIAGFILNYKKKIQESDNSEFIKDIKSLEKTIDTLEKSIVEFRALLVTKNINLEKAEKLITDLELKLKNKNKHKSLESYKVWLKENTKKIVKKYNYDGKGYKDVTTIFSRSLVHEDLIKDFTLVDMGFDGSKYKTADKLIYYFNKIFSKVFPTRTFYEYDKPNWGRSEYWATVDKIIAKFRIKKRKADDCDGFMTLKYCMLYYLLKDYFPNDLWRLRGFIVDIWTGGGHAMLAWVKGGNVNDWIPIETTFYDSRFPTVWNNNYKIRDQMLYQIRYSFDNKYAYVKI